MKHFALIALFVPAIAWAQAPPIFEKEIAPILQARCASCHGEKEQKNGLDLRTVASMLRGGKSGPAIFPGSPERSLLFLQLAGNKMPPGKDKLSDAEKGLIRAWLDGGAKSTQDKATFPQIVEKPITDRDRNFWSFRTPVRPPVPRSAEANPIDAFILASLQAKGLSFSPAANRHTLIRRAYFALIGLPPSPADVAAFVNDRTPDAWERLIDRLLASPQYGERWGRHWLDLAGYADSEGILDADYVRTAAWRYRDYVIRSLNSDKPYDRFLKEQIAGDELARYWRERETGDRSFARCSPSIAITSRLCG